MLAGGKLPQHIGIIMDGNGRWAELRGLSRIEGHRQGARRSKDIISAATGAGVKVLTLYAFSIENWDRPQEEVETLMGLLEYYLREEIEDLIEKRSIVFRVIGDKGRLPGKIQELIADLENRTRTNTGMTLVPAISYGGRDEIVRAVKRIVAEKVPPERIDETVFDGYLDTAGLPPVDLIIRTSGEKRISNFLPWQGAYAEFYFTETLWPDFTEEEFLSAIGDYQKRERRFGVIREGGWF
ncbi:MAG: polyprenyl diphosphate synthase [bacterium]